MRRWNFVAVVILSLGFGIGPTFARRAEGRVLPTKPKNPVNYEKCPHFVNSGRTRIEDRNTF